jgi:ABC-type glycerol-3-phosphate transport system substrate-binding protein
MVHGWIKCKVCVKGLSLLLGMTLMLGFGLTTVVAAQEKVKLEFALSAGWQPVPYRRALDKFFSKEYPNIEVKITTTPFPQYHDRLVTRIAAGDIPDLADVNDFQIDRFTTLNVLTDLTSYVKKTWDIEKPGWGNFYPHLIKTHSRKGVPYGVPAEMNIFVTAFKVDAFREAGIPTPYELYKQDNWIRFWRALRS